MVQPHVMYGWQMTALQALALLRRMGEINRQQARQMRSLLVAEEEVQIPDSLVEVCERMYLAEVMPANRLPV